MAIALVIALEPPFAAPKAVDSPEPKKPTTDEQLIIVPRRWRAMWRPAAWQNRK